MNFETILVCAVTLTGLMTLARSLKIVKSLPAQVEYVRSFFPVLLLVLIIRSFLMQLHYVPTGSLEPTVLPGDLVATNQFSYGLHLPITNTKIFEVGKPKIGDVVVFSSPLDPKTTLVKRVIGTPGDHISYLNKQLMINGMPAVQVSEGKGVDIEPNGNIIVEQKLENLAGAQHKIFIKFQHDLKDNFEVIVPPHQYFVMGDNRDNSFDSRDWGFVPERNLIGKAFAIVLSWDMDHFKIRWKRTGEIL